MMDIYFGHSSSVDFEELYDLLRQSRIDDEHNLVLPHEGSEEPFDSKRFLRNECDLVVADVSEPSTGLGIELGWADLFDVKVLAVHSDGSQPSSSIEIVADLVKSYGSRKELPKTVIEAVDNL